MSVIAELLTGYDMTLGSEVFACILAAMAAAAVLAYAITVHSGRLMSRLVRRVDMSALSRAVLVLMLVMTVLFCGYWGLVMLLTCTLIGMAPLLLGTRRIHLTGCLIVPVLLFKLGIF